MQLSGGTPYSLCHLLRYGFATARAPEQRHGETSEAEVVVHYGCCRVTHCKNTGWHIHPVYQLSDLVERVLVTSSFITQVVVLCIEAGGDNRFFDNCAIGLLLIKHFPQQELGALFLPSHGVIRMCGGAHVLEFF